MPSKKLIPAGFFIAKPSARPITMQLVMIKPTKTESCLLMSKRKAFRNWSTTITKDAMTVIWTMIRMLLGMNDRIALTARLLNPVTATTARLITTDVSILVVTARALQIPRICKAIGLLSISGPTKASFALMVVAI